MAKHVMSPAEYETLRASLLANNISPITGQRHEFSEEQDAAYPHLTRAHCSCGWSSGGYSKIARHFWDQHVTEAGAAPQ